MNLGFNIVMFSIVVYEMFGISMRSDKIGQILMVLRLVIRILLMGDDGSRCCDRENLV